MMTAPIHIAQMSIVHTSSSLIHPIQKLAHQWRSNRQIWDLDKQTSNVTDTETASEESKEALEIFTQYFEEMQSMCV